MGRDLNAFKPREDDAGVSIHAPRMGRDHMISDSDGAFALFQFTRPAWGATGKDNGYEIVVMVSIHAPRMGRDRIVEEIITRWASFNSRAPHGARPTD